MGSRETGGVVLALLGAAALLMALNGTAANVWAALIGKPTTGGVQPTGVPAPSPAQPLPTQTLGLPPGWPGSGVKT